MIRVVCRSRIKIGSELKLGYLSIAGSGIIFWGVRRGLPRYLLPVLRIRDVYPGSASKNLSILTQKIVSKLSELWSGLFIPDPGYRGHKGTGSRILDPQHCLLLWINFRNFCWRASLVQRSQVQWCERRVALAARPPRPPFTQSGRRLSVVQSGSRGTSPSQSHQVSLCTQCVLHIPVPGYRKAFLSHEPVL